MSELPIEVEAIMEHGCIWRATLGTDRIVTLWCRKPDDCESTIRVPWCMGNSEHPAHMSLIITDPRLTPVIATLTILLCDILCDTECN